MINNIPRSIAEVFYIAAVSSMAFGVFCPVDVDIKHDLMILGLTCMCAGLTFGKKNL